MKFRPLRDRVVVRREEKEAKTSGGILLPDSAKEKPAQGTVIAVGPGAVTSSGEVRPCDLNEGDKVIFGQYAGNAVKTDDGEELLILSESEIYAVIV